MSLGLPYPWYKIRFDGEYEDKKQRVDCLPQDVKKVIMKGKKIIIILTNGNKGVVECHDGDEYDVLSGYEMAYYKAKYGKCFELRNILMSCLNSANRKGYKQAILKNYED